MGEVYRANDLKLGREVAIKVLPERFTADPESTARSEFREPVVRVVESWLTEFRRTLQPARD
jgi:hypothetical protein